MTFLKSPVTASIEYCWGMKRQKTQKSENRGNYAAYYGYRQNDKRIEILSELDLESKRVLDIGCNSGRILVELLKKSNPALMLGIDCDRTLIKKAWNHLSLEFSLHKPYTKEPYFPLSCPLTLGSIPHPQVAKFKCLDICADTLEGNFDVVLCLSVTKWIHLDYGDEGIKNLFGKVFQCLNVGGVFILEPQLFKSYKKKSKSEFYESIKLFPEAFPEYLRQLGFEFIETKYTGETGGFDRPIHIFRK